MKAGCFMRGVRKTGWAGTTALLAVLTAVLLSGCGETSATVNQLLPNADPGKGVQAFRHYGCVSCHVIPGVDGANGYVGPPLTQLGKREYIGGRLPNTPANLIYWLEKPQQVDPGIDMPNMGVTPSDARNMAAYLENLK